MAALTVQPFTLTGVAVTTAAAAGGGDTFANDATEKTFLYVNNGGGGGITVTITAQTTSITTTGYGLVTIEDRTYSVGAGEAWYMGPFDKDAWNNSSGSVEVGYSGVTSVTVAAIRMS